MLKSNSTDEAYYSEGDRPPIKACLMHPHRVTTEFYTAEPQLGYAGVRYGLCWECADALDRMPLFQVAIDEKITERLKILMEG
jgi:hypothetical protein